MTIYSGKADVEAQQNLLEQEIVVESGGIRRLAEIEAVLTDDAFAPLEREKLEEIDAELRGLGYDPLNHETIRQREQTGRVFEQRYNDLEKAHATLAPLKRELDDLKEQVRVFEREAHDHKDQCIIAQSQVDATKASMPDLEKAEREYNLLKEKENVFVKELALQGRKLMC